jgi:C4-type Zn-finger protein
MSEELDKFQAVCPVCGSIFDLNEKTTATVWTQNPMDLLRITCPDCEYERCTPIPAEED